MRYIICCCAIIFLCLVGGCQVLNAPNMPATISAQNTAFAVEETSMPQSLQSTAVALAGTAVAAETSVASINSVSRQLAATAVVAVPITPQVQVGAAPIITNNGDGTQSIQSSASGTNTTTTSSLTNIVVTDSKRNSDGCAGTGSLSQFPVDSSTIYAITRAPSISSGAVVAVEWKYQGQVVSSGSYTVPQDESDFCIWFPLDPATVPFTAGSWSVQFSLNGGVVEPTMFFNIGEAPTAGQ